VTARWYTTWLLKWSEIEARIDAQRQQARESREVAAAPDVSTIDAPSSDRR